MENNETPVNLDAERAVLGSLMLDPHVIPDHDNLPIEAFYREQHRKILKAIRAINNRQELVDLVSLTEELRKLGHLRNSDDALYLVGLTEGITTSQINTYARIVREKWKLRQIINVANKTRGQALSQEHDPNEILIELEKDLTHLRTERESGPQSYADEALQILEEDGGGYILTGLPSFDSLTGGMTGLTIIGGRPSQGKSALSRSIALYNARRRRKVALFSQDQPGADVYRIIASQKSRVPLWKIKTKNASNTETNLWREAVLELRDNMHDWLAVDSHPYTIDQLASRIRAAVRWGAQLVIVDYLQLVGVPGASIDNETASVTHTSKVLKHLTQELGVAILAIVQLNRGVEMRTDKRPNLADIRSSGQVEQDAEMVCFLYRDAYYESRQRGAKEPNVSEAEVIIAKNKTGPTGTVRVMFNGEFMEFAE